MCGGTTVALPATVKRVHARTIQLHGAWAYVRGAYVRAHTWVEQCKRHFYIYPRNNLYFLLRKKKNVNFFIKNSSCTIKLTHLYMFIYMNRNTILYYHSWTTYCKSNYISYISSQFFNVTFFYIYIYIWQELCTYAIVEYTALVTCHVLVFARECTWMRGHTHARTRTRAHNHAFSDVLKRAALRTQT